MFSELARLFDSPTRIKLIKFFALQPDERLTAKAVAPTLNTTKQKLQPELGALVRAGVLVARPGKGGVQYGWNRAYPHAFALHQFMSATTTPEDKVIADMFRALGASLVVAAGILADETRGAVDLLIVTRRPKDQKIAVAIRKLEGMAAIPIRYAVLGVEEYQDRMQAFDRMLRDIVDFRHRVVLGSRNAQIHPGVIPIVVK